jgi:hypothetical protein
MKKLSVVIIISLLALGCGSGTGKKTDMTENPKIELIESNYYPVTVIKSPQTSELQSAFISIPDGFFLDKEIYTQSGNLIFKHNDNISTFSIQCKVNPGLNDAMTFLDMDVVKPNSKVFAFGKREDINNWSTPMPMFEETLAAEASFSTIGYDRMVEEQELTGKYFVWWFNYVDAKESKANMSFAIIMSQECKKSEWNKFSPMFDIMRKTFFRLPSRSEVTMGKGKNELNLSDMAVALRITKDRLFSLVNGQPLAPGWETLIGQYVFAIDKENEQVYLVKNEKTASGLLSHPTKSGWTVDPNLDESLFGYLPLPDQPTVPSTPIKKSQP